MTVPVIPPLTVAAARRALAKLFRDSRLDSPELDARILVGHALGLDHAALAATDRALTRAEAERVAAFGRRRCTHEPVARIVGEKEFWGLDFRVTPDVLVPRPDTETVIEAALAALDQRDARMAQLRIADLGTGSGALLVALLRELPNAAGVGTDRSTAALGVARLNARRHAVADRASFVACDYGSALAGLDLVVANPPYIGTHDIAGLAAEVRDHDPRLALDGGADGLDAFRVIAADMTRLLRPGGVLVVEIGHSQSGDVAAIFARQGLSAGVARPDLSGVARAFTVCNP